MILFKINLNDAIFIIGDLNMNLFNIDSVLPRFILNYNFYNAVKDSTRVSAKYYKNSNRIKTSKSLIDVLIHNQNNIIKCITIDNCISDQKFVYAELKIRSSAITKQVS